MNGFLEHYLREGEAPDNLPTLKSLTRDYVAYLLSVCADDRAEVCRILAVSEAALEHTLAGRQPARRHS